jgi:hypothetical protein
MSNIRKVDPLNYVIPKQGGMFHQNLRWFANADDSLLGTVVFDLVDFDFSWVVLARETGYGAVDLATSVATYQAAELGLFSAMLNREHGGKPAFGPKDLEALAASTGRTVEEMFDVIQEVEQQFRKP